MRDRTLGALVLCLASAPLAANTYTVTSTADSGAGSLRQAITDANANAGPDTIAFAIVGSGVQTIQPLSALPTVTDAVTIDGYTQPDSSANTNDTTQGLNAVILIELDGTLAGAAVAGLTVSASDTTIRGLVINRFGGDGISLTSGAFSGHTIQGCYIGTDPAGTLALGNRYGIFLGGGSTRLIGGTTPAARNLISGNDRAISTADASSSGNTIQGNLINTDVTGTINLGGIGFKFRVIKDSLVGGTDPAARNVIVGNDDILDLGYAIATTQTSGNFIQGNFLGTDVTGTKLLTSADHIIGIFNQPNTIGGSAPGAGNVIAGGTTRGNIWHEAAAGVVIQGNFIGTDLTGTIPLGTSSFGIRLANGAVVGGTNPGEGNTIAFNGTAGVLPKGSGNSVRGNRIYQNGGLGIDLQTTGVTINDLGDGDAGDNLQQNFPLVTSVTYGATDTTIEGTLNSAASTVFDLDFYSNPVCQARPQDYREAHEYLGATQVTTDGSGNAVFSVTLPVALDAGSPITATATDPAGNTSELTPRIIFTTAPGSGPPAGGTVTTIKGLLFEAGATVDAGGTPATDVVVTNATTITAAMPALPAGSLHDVTVTNPSGLSGTLSNGWVANFNDVPNNVQFYGQVIKLVANGITAGVGGGNYGIGQSTLRQQMAVFLLKAKFGLCYAPPPCTGTFADVTCPSTFASWIEALAAEGITGGCGGGNYCPGNPVRRDQMAVFILKAVHGSGFVPPACSGDFGDVACPGPFADWIEQLAAEGVTGGCGGGNYCPGNNVTRGQMAAFLVNAFDF
jgi:hypothetical protein